ncbi:MAG: IS1 family transposase [Thermoleophilaceae bacterium]
MNRLTTEKRAQIIGALVEGNSIRATCRMTGAAKNTVTKLLVDLGEACEKYQDRVMRDLPCGVVEVDEIWCFCYAKQKNVPEEHKGTFGYGNVWTWTALDADTKLVPTWLVGERTVNDGWAFLNDLKKRLRDPHIQLTTDGHPAYSAAVGLSFGTDLDYAQLMKVFKGDPRDERRYSPPVCIGTETKVLKGDPDPARISTSYVERQNLTMRMGMRRFTRLTNAFSKKVENLTHAVALHYMHYNFCRVHSTIKTTPTMVAGVADHVWTVREIAELLD